MINRTRQARLAAQEDPPKMTTKTLLSGTSTDATDFVQLEPGRWKIALSLASTDAASIAINEKISGGTARVVSKSGAAVALIEADPAIEYASAGELVSVTRSGGTASATVTATLIERGGKR